MNSDLVLIRSELKLLREIKQLTVKEISSVLKVSQSTYRGYEISGKIPTHVSVKIYRELGYNIFKNILVEDDVGLEKYSDTLSVLIKIQQLVDLLKMKI